MPTPHSQNFAFGYTTVMTKPYNHRDRYTKKARESGLRARSFFKIEEIDKKEHLLRPGMQILDLGAAPGSFMQYAVRVLGASGLVIGIDLTKIQPIGGPAKTVMHQGDIFAEETKAWLKETHPRPFDAIVSDLAPKTTGMKDVDHWASIKLSHEVLHYCKDFLKPGGSCLMKVFQGEDFDRFLHQAKRRFRTVKIRKPDAVRDRSREVYVVCTGFIGGGNASAASRTPGE